jgi:hypothetical protein
MSIQRKKLNYRESKAVHNSIKEFIEKVNKIDPALAYLFFKNISIIHPLLDGYDEFEGLENHTLEYIKEQMSQSKYNREYVNDVSMPALMNKKWCKIFGIHPYTLFYVNQESFDSLSIQFRNKLLEELKKRGLPVSNDRIIFDAELTNALNLSATVTNIHIFNLHKYLPKPSEVFITDLVKIKEIQCSVFKEELIQKTMHPSKIVRLFESGIDADELDNLI